MKKLEYPAGLSPEQRKQYRQQVQQQIDALKKRGWSEESLLSYIKYLNAHPQAKHKHLTQIYAQTKVAGSKVFNGMWQAWKTENNPKAARAKVTLLLNLIQVMGKLPESMHRDKKEVQKMLGRFDKHLAPDDDFWDSLAQTVQTAYPEQTTLGDDQLGERIHNFRYVISAQQAQYIRDNYQGKTDQEKLAQYLAGKTEGIDYSLRESDRLHQKKASEGAGPYPEGYADGNFKVVIGFHTEFIINSEGRFQNEIDPEGVTKNGVINGASFNYANQNDDKHARLDVNYGDSDPKWRKQIIAVSKYAAPSKEKYKKNYQYGIKGISSKENADRLKQKFYKGIPQRRTLPSLDNFLITWGVGGRY